MAGGAFGETRTRGPGHALSLLLRLIAGVISLWFVAIILILAINFLMQFFGANMSTGFATWITSHSTGAMSPFSGMFATRHPFGSSVFDTSMLAAIIIYAIIGSTLASLLAWFSNLMNS